MQVDLTPEAEAHLQELATRTGENAGQIVRKAVDWFLQYDADFIAAIEQGRAAVQRGDLLDHDEVVNRIEQMFRS